MKKSRVICHTKSMISTLLLAVFAVFQHQKRLVKENLFRFRLHNTMFAGTFSRVTRIPFKSRYCSEVNHVCILPSYTLQSKTEGKKAR